jgi:hypothetical protein
MTVGIFFSLNSDNKIGVAQAMAVITSSGK